MVDINLFCLLFICVSAVSAEYCDYYVDSFWGTQDRMYCPYDCCGDMYNRYCCNNGVVGAIVGIVIGTICGVILIVSIIVAVCCCLRKSRGQQGQVCQPVQTTQSAVNINYGYPSATVAYGVPGYTNTGFIQTTNMATGTAIPPAQAQPSPYAEPPPKYEELNATPAQPNY
ncbi:hypothetical protein ACF0H5_003011 [Mactra antiquata]